MFTAYLPVFLMLGVALLVAVGVFALTTALGPKNMTAEKAIPYESGSETTGASHIRLSIKFYLTAILFVRGRASLLSSAGSASSRWRRSWSCSA
jgi:NADH-quinone oxidoreductase subunit A